MVKIDVSGAEELIAEFERMGSDEIKTLERDAVKSGAEIVKRNQESNWNRSDKDGEHIQDNINVGRAYDMEEGTGINIGPKMSLRWRAKFVEYGTSHQPPQAPVDKSRIQSEATASKEMMDVLGRVVE